MSNAHREDATPEEPVVHDRRRIDPLTGAVRGRDPGTAAGPAARPSSPSPAADLFDGEGEQVARDLAAGIGGVEQLADELDRARTEATERLEDLRRLQAEYVNYRRRVDRDRELVRQTAVAGALGELLPILDDIGRARDHGDLTGGFKAVADALEAAVTKLGLERYGEPGDPFDPAVHEALMHRHSADVDGPTCVDVLMPGYRFGERIVRAARVAVAEPEA